MSFSNEKMAEIDLVAQFLGYEVESISNEYVYFKCGLSVGIDSAAYNMFVRLADQTDRDMIDCDLMITRLALKIANQAQQIRQLNGAIERRNRKINGLRVKNADLKQALDDESEAVDNLLVNFNDMPKPKKEPRLIASADPVRGVTIYDHGFWGADVTLFGAEV